MATYKIGSSGSGVSDLQRLLNQNGANLTVDGQYGSQTEAAVRAYQKANGLSVDGIAGSQTLGKLNGTSSGGSSGGSARTTAQMLAAYESGDNAYKPNYQTQINDLLGRIQNREPFQYDFASDPVYQNYAERYMYMGRQAMKDAMAQSMQNSGGFANTWAQTAGQQAYDDYLTRLGEIVPQLQQNAYAMWQNEGDQLRQNLAMYQGLDAQDYERWLDQRNYWYNKFSDEQQTALARAAGGSGGYSGGSGSGTYGKVGGNVPTSVNVQNTLSSNKMYKATQGISAELGKYANGGASRSQLGAKLNELLNSSQYGLSAAEKAAIRKEWDNSGFLDEMYLNARKASSTNNRYASGSSSVRGSGTRVAQTK